MQETENRRAQQPGSKHCAEYSTISGLPLRSDAVPTNPPKTPAFSLGPEPPATYS